MKIRRFFAPDIRQAMRLVREAQGPDAVILSNRKVEGGVEIVAAMDFDETLLSPSATTDNGAPRIEAAPPLPSARTAAQIGMFQAVAQTAPTSKPMAQNMPRLTQAAKTPAPVQNNMPVSRPPTPAQNPISKPTAMAQNAPVAKAPTSAAKLGGSKPATPSSFAAPAATATPPSRIPSYNPPEARISTGSTWSSVGDDTETNGQEVSYDSSNSRRTSTAPRAADAVWTQDPVLVNMGRELKELRGLLEHQLSGLAWSETTRRTPVQARLLRALSELGLTMSLSKELTAAVSTTGEFDTAWRHAMGLLAERLTVDEDAILEQGGVVALVGATGVGKTTTVAKLAAHYALRHGRERVALVTTDGYRIGSQEQLRTFARILGVPMRTVADAGELSEALEGLSDCGLVLIDTAGMSQRDVRLSEQFATLRGAGREIRSYLVLSAITQRLGLEEVIRAFSDMEVAGCILTKLDEAASLGEVLSVVVRHKLPITYLGVGQRVPEDLLPARAHNLISRAVALLQQHAPDLEEESLAMAFGSTSRYATV